MADAQIFPDSGRVIIRKKAEMDQLKNAEIVANYLTKYHKIINVTADIKSRLNYSASGDYAYIDELQNEQIVHFADISLDTNNATYAKGMIEEDIDFMLSPHFGFKGEIEMFANNKNITFNGFTKINHNCEGIERNWMAFKSEIDPLEIAIPVGQTIIDENKNDMGAGLVMNPDTVGVYRTFISSKHAQNHIDLIKGEGFLVYDKGAKEYQISNKEKLKERSLPGTFVSLHTESCEMNGDGKLGFACDFGQVKLTPVGYIKYNNSSQVLNITASMGVQFPFNDNAMEKFVAKFEQFVTLDPVDIGRTNYEKALREELGLEEADKIISDISIEGAISKKNFADKLKQTFYLADVRLVWNPETGSYQSQGKIGIANMGKNQVFKYMEGHVELEKKRGGDILYIYLKFDDKNWYFFNYRNEIMEVISSDEEFNTIISETKSENRKFKGGKGEADYQYMLSSKVKRNAFLRRFDN